MVPLASLWLPIVVSAVIVFLASWVLRILYALLTAGVFGWLWPR